jgi:histidinol-phosphate aminotransferase
MTGLQQNQHLLQVPLYIAGKSAEEVRQELGLSDVIKLASNENPLGPSPRAMEALAQAMAEAHRYPGLADRELRQRLAAHHGSGLTLDHFLIGNGATDILRILAQSFVFNGGETVFSRVSFPLYGLLTTMYGGKSVAVEPLASLGIDLEAMAEAVTGETRLVWLCSPNNPTGLALEHQAVEAWLDGLPEHVAVAIDESYADFGDDEAAVDSLAFVRDGRPVIAVRSFSKNAGLANLRIGYAAARPDVIEYLLHAVLPFNTGAPVVRAAMASLEDHDFHRRSRDLVTQERAYLTRELTTMGLAPLPSQANFLLLPNVPNCEAVAQGLLHRGVIVRTMGPWGLPYALRVSLGLREHNARFVAALTEVLREIRSGKG